MELRQLLLLVWLVGAALAAPSVRDGSSCSTHCPHDAGKFRYEDGKTYVYSVEGTNSISVDKTAGKRPITYRLNAEITVKSRCEMYLQITDFNMHYGGQRNIRPAFAEEAMRHSLPFAIHDGQVEHICPSPEDSDAVRNLKRGILSTLQNSMTSLTMDTYLKESDILGECDTKYQIMEYEPKVVVKKLKNIRSCTNRNKYSTAILAQLYESPHSNFQHIPILSDEAYECNQTIENNVIQSVTCKERSVFQPFTRHQHVATLETEMIVHLVNVKKNPRQDITEVTERVGLGFSFIPSYRPEAKESEAISLIREICPKIDGVVHKSVVSEFPKLVDILKKMSPHSVEKAYNAVRKGRPCKSPKALDIYLDALPMAATAGPVQLMAKLIESQSVNKVRANIWMTLLALTPRPTEDTVNAAVPLLRSEIAGRQALLGVSSLIYRFCTYKDNCEDVPAVQSAIEALHKRLGYKCRVDNQDEEDKIIGVLKAFGNLGVVGEAKNSILECATTTGSTSVPIRLAAIEAFRRTKPDDEVKNKLLELYGNNAEDIEIRIASYLALMKWPSKDTVKKIMEIYDKETSKQVGSFTWTHLTNLKESSAPLKQEIQQLLSDIEPKKKFSTDWWRYSNNKEWSHFYEELNIGGEIEENTIFTTDSHFPKATSLNLGVDIFNHHINLMEVGGRMEGLDYTLEKIFGPHGILEKNNPVNKFISQIRGEEDDNEVSNRVRTKRDTSNAYQPKLDLFDERVNAVTRDDPQGSTYFKVFGNELAWFRFRNLHEDFSLGNNIDLKSILKEMMHNNKFDATRNFMFLDAEVQVPSITGRSYHMSLRGNGNIGLKAEGTFDVNDFHNKNFNIEGRLQPSATLEISANINILSAAMPGVKLVSTLFTSVDVNGKLQMKDGRMVVAQVNLPSDKVEIFSFKTDMYEVDNMNKDKPADPSEIHNFNHCTRSFTKAFGVEFCGKFNLHRPAITSERPYVPITGPIDIEFSIKKTDLLDKGFEFIAEMPNSLDDPDQIYRLSFDTPESRVSRKHAGQLRISKEDEKIGVKLDLQCMEKTLEVSASHLFRNNFAQTKAEVYVNKARTFSIAADLQVAKQGETWEFKPKLEVNGRKSEPFILSGTVAFSLPSSNANRKELTIDLKTNSPSSKPAQMQGRVTVDGEVIYDDSSVWTVLTDFNVTLPSIDLRVHGSKYKQGRTFSTESIVEYQRPGFSRHVVKLNGKIQDLSTEHLTKINSVTALQSSQYPEYNWQLNWDTVWKRDEHVENDITLRYGEDLQNEEHLIHLLQVSKLSGKYAMNVQASSENKLVFKAPDFGIDVAINLNTEWDFSDAPRFHVKAGVQRSSEKFVNVEVRSSQQSRKPVNLAVEWKLEYPGRKIVYRDQLEELSPNEFRGKCYFQWQEGEYVITKYTYRRKSNDEKIHHEVEATVEHPSLHEPILYKAQIIQTKDAYDYHSSLKMEGHPEYYSVIKARNGYLEIFDYKSIGMEANIQRDQAEPHKWTYSFLLEPGFDVYRAKGLLYYSSQNELPNLQLKMKWEVNQDEPHNIEVSSVVKSTTARDGKYRVETTILINEAETTVENEGIYRWTGPHDMKLKMQGGPIQNTELTFHYAIADNKLTSLIKVEDDTTLLKIDITGKFILEGSKLDVGGKVSITSPTHRKLGGKELSYNLLVELLQHQKTIMSDLRIQVSPGKMYTNKLDYSRTIGPSSGSIRARALVTSPNPSWKSEQVSLSTEYNRHSLNFNVDVSSSTGKKLEVSTSMEITGYSARFRQYLRTPFVSLQSLKVDLKYEFKRDHALIHTLLEANRQKKFEFYTGLNDTATSLNIVSSLSTSATPTLRAHIQAITESHTTKYEASLQKESLDLLLWKATMTHRTRGFILKMTLDRRGSRILEMDVVNSVPTYTERKYKIDFRGPFTPFTVNIQVVRNGDELRPTVGICVQNEIGCLSVEGSYKKEPREEMELFYRELQLVLKMDGRDDMPFHFLYKSGNGVFRNKMLVGTARGYDLNLDLASDTPNMGLTVFLPTRQMETKGRIKRSERHWAADLQVRSDVQNHPDRKLTFTIDHRTDQDYDDIYEARTTFTIDHLVFQQPISLKIHTKLNGESSSKPVAVKAEFEYCSTPADKLYTEFLMEGKHENDDNYNMTYILKLYRQDRELDAIAKFHDSTVGDRYSNGLEWEWKDRFGETKKGFSMIELDETDVFKVNLWHYRPHKSIEIHGRHIPIDDDKTIQAEFDVRYDGQDSKLVLTVLMKDEHTASTQIEVYHPPGTLYKKLYFSESTTARPLIVWTAHSYEGGEKITELALTISEWENELLDLHVHWSTDYASRLMMEVMQIPMILQEYAMGEAAQEIQDKFLLVESSFKQCVMDPWHSYASEEAERFRGELRKEMKIITEVLESLYNRLPSAETINQVIEELEAFVAAVVESIIEFVDTVTPELVSEWIRSARDWIHETWNEKCQANSHCSNIHKAYHDSDWGKVREELHALVTSLPNMALEATMNVIKEIGDKIDQMYDNMKNAFCDMLDRLEKRLQDSEVLKKWRDTIVNTYDKVVDKLGEYRYKAARKAEELIREVLKNDDVKVVVDFITAVAEEMKIEYFNHRPNIVDRLNDLLEDKEEPKRPPFQPLSFDPEKGDFRAVIHAPKFLKSLRSKSISDDWFDDDDDEEDDDFDESYYTTMKNNLIQMTRLVDHRFRPSEKALLIGSRHYVTFDKKFYDFEGDCTYLLARDFVDKNFTVMVKYKDAEDKNKEESPGKSVIVLLNGRTIEIDPHSKTVLLDDQIVELPIVDDPVTVMRIGENIVVDNKHGLTVECHLKYDVCSTTISGWYYGKTAGMFGTYDYEPGNDMRRPRGQIAGTVSNFARSWELGRRNCRSKNLAKDVVLPKDHEYYRKCKDLFQDDESPLSTCFSTVSADEYFRMCLKHAATVSDPKKAMCDVAAAYVSDCNNHYMELLLPTECLTCDSLHGRALEFGDERTYKSGIPKSADIVFVVEERQCNRPIIKDIDSIVRLVDRELVTSGYTNNRYGVVGFGGSSERSLNHAHTARGNLFFEVPDVILATERMTFHNGRNGRVNAFGALYFAEQYPFRPGVAKVMILMTCSACKEDHMTISYPITQQMLLERGIILHVLNDRGIEIKGSVTKSRGIMAVDADTVYRGKDVTQRELEGEPDLRSQVAVPKDVCITLAQEVGGSFFTTSALKDSQYTDVKNWKSLFARRIAMSAESPKCQWCECVSVEDGTSRTLCGPCVTPRPKVPISLFTSEDPEYF